VGKFVGFGPSAEVTEHFRHVVLGGDVDKGVLAVLQRRQDGRRFESHSIRGHPCAIYSGLQSSEGARWWLRARRGDKGWQGGGRCGSVQSHCRSWFRCGVERRHDSELNRETVRQGAHAKWRWCHMTTIWLTSRAKGWVLKATVSFIPPSVRKRIARPPRSDTW